jgi:hypothetical protein
MRRLGIAVLGGVLFCAPVLPSFAECPSGKITNCACPQLCDLDRCERRCYLIRETREGCLWRCDSCDCQLIGAVLAAPLLRLGELFVSNAQASEAEGNEIHLSNEDGDFLYQKKAKSALSDEDAVVGVTIRPIKGRLFVADVEVGGPAWEAGVRPGDELLAIDGKPSGSIPKKNIFKALRGKAGSQARFRIRSGNELKPRDVLMKRVAQGSFGINKAGATARSVPMEQFGGSCPKDFDGCHFLLQEGKDCLFSCKNAEPARRQ